MVALGLSGWVFVYLFKYLTSLWNLRLFYASWNSPVNYFKLLPRLIMPSPSRWFILRMGHWGSNIISYSMCVASLWGTADLVRAFYIYTSYFALVCPHTVLLRLYVSVWWDTCSLALQARDRGVKCRSEVSTSNTLQTTAMLQEVSATLCCNDPIWHSREEGYRWGVVWYLTEWSPCRLQQTPHRCVLELLSPAGLKWTKSGFKFWWFCYLITVSLN